MGAMTRKTRRRPIPLKSVSEKLIQQWLNKLARTMVKSELSSGVLSPSGNRTLSSMVILQAAGGVNG